MIGVEELANALGVSTKTIYAMVESDQIPCYRIGCGRGTLRFDLAEVRAFLKHESRRMQSELARPSARHLA
ncbi:helix-turn-helix domain-containing protein [Roseiconus lacunae]|uniref:helix-turn-helix domain-containing protein n=1 Tax=Roseiconus lacunae TaxID=2605694 RepID=UPI001E4CB6C9|nr:helix-turn-helix domain-containing protein [Roseiconus lacunae]MCD0460697.1 helix-turn-helix domain-containing protein [Roseiconus lacunae]